MAELYLTLVSGRTVHVCSDWDGLAPTRIGTVDATGAPDDGEGIEVGEYFRDIFRTTVSVKVKDSMPTAFSLPQTLNGAMIPTAASVTSSDFGPNVTAVTPSGSDDHLHEKPRTWQKVSTWLVFTGTAGTYHWRAASVDGWSSKAPID